ncbi:hypothetical protein O181_079913 [Austropuccinia psidii MF-1]|uniref:Uncharacterized protein n=1 Tax=Austropuccinia psidii MF-1 TaxID=1389203 RepID=A0A9Q3FHP0_9BASI|nr:hypothetical protein [Austropuccinia psidii MF-1]
MKSYLHIKSFLGQEKTIKPLVGWSPLSCKDKVNKIKNWLKNQSLSFIEQKSSKLAPQHPKHKPKGPQKKQRGPRKNQGKANWHRPYPQGCRIPELEISEMGGLFNISRTLMELTAKEQERMKRTFTRK